ncbi:MAG: ABC transporter permease [Bacillota bacterium]
MARYILQRVFAAFVALWILTTVTFVLMHAIPGGPFTRERNVPEAIMRNLDAKYHLNDPLWKQYLDYLGGVARFDLGPSFKFPGQTVNDFIRRGFPVSAELGIIAIILSMAVGIPAGIISALRQNKWQDNTTMLVAIVGVSVPSFIIAPVLMYVFALKLHWLPAAMWGDWKQVIMPAVALALLPLATFSRLMRSSMLDVISQDYIKTARAKGLSELAVTWRHAVKNAIMPIVTYLGPLIAAILTGTFVIEQIFAIPGLGRQFVWSVNNRDYTTILGLTVFYGAFLLIMNLIVDIIYGFLDPRIQLTGRKE